MANKRRKKGKAGAGLDGESVVFAGNSAILEADGAGPGFGREETLLGFGQALRRRREHLKMTLDGLAALTGISKPYLSNIETARAPGPPSEEKLERMAGALGLVREELVAAADWLRTPESVRRMLTGGAVARREDGAVDVDAVLGDVTRRREGTKGHDVLGVEDGGGVFGVVGVPVINKVAAGKAAEFSDMDYPSGVADAYVPMADFPESRGEMGGAFAVRVSGDSMEPEYVEGETVVVSGAEAEDGDDCVVRLGERENFATTLKRVFFVREGEEVVAVRLVPLNGKYAERVVGLEEVSGVYPVMYKVTRVKGKEGREGKSSKGKSSKEAGGSFKTQDSSFKEEGGLSVSPPTAAGDGRGGKSSGFSLEND